MFLSLPGRSCIAELQETVDFCEIYASYGYKFYINLTLIVHTLYRANFNLLGFTVFVYFWVLFSKFWSLFGALTGHHGQSGAAAY